MRRIIVRGLNADLSITAAQDAAEQATAAASTAAAQAAAGVAAATSADRTAAQSARAGAEAARDDAEALVISDLGTTDGQTRALIESPVSQTAAALSATFVPRAGPTQVTISGSRPDEYFRTVNASNQSTYHVIAADGFTGPYLIGVGVNEDGATGLVLDPNKPNTTGGQVNLLPGCDAASFGLDITNETPGTNLRLSGVDATGLLLDIQAAGTPAADQVMLKIRSDVLAPRGYFGTDMLKVFADTGLIDFTAPVTRVNGGRFSVQAVDVLESEGKSRVNIEGGGEVEGFTPFIGLYGAGAGPLLFATRIIPNGSTARLQGVDGVAPVGGHTGWQSLIEFGVSSGDKVLGFYGKAPAPQPARPTDIAGVIAALVTLGLTA